MNLLNAAIALAAREHDGQVDKSGEPYILHPLRVMLALQTEDERIVGVLHDVVEDSPTGAEAVRTLMKDRPDLWAAVDAVTHRPSEPRPAYYKRVRQNPAALRVKFEDLRDNTSPVRIEVIRANDPETYERLMGKYLDAVQHIWSALHNAGSEEAEDWGLLLSQVADGLDRRTSP